MLPAPAHGIAGTLWLRTLLIGGLLASCPVLGWSWGKLGHATVAEIAATQLTPAATVQVSSLLKNDLDRDQQPSGRTTLAQIASWPDEIREIAPAGTYQGWHTRANPVCSEALGACKDGYCVDQLIIHYAQILQDPSQTPRARNEALKWVVHLVGDLHMPMHSGVHGKNIAVSLEGQSPRPDAALHWAWDNTLAKLALQSGPLVLTPLPDFSAAPAADAPTQWMRETRLLSRQFVFDPLAGFSCGVDLQGPVVLDLAYQQQAAPVIRKQIAKAGLRLAQLLNAVLH
ncbi:S1/P1 nuclease [Rhodoferax fermentans]|uniref:Endonuclease n=1 Tax=Rhodoferax fermentans TaxID=28066 RepID=A0A1T1AWZ0_RHOFE|nr:S1/P1 nuclease [Rhodoferax fermentans]MBK1682537.1 hypothetical protein [Rhodoferax fermentans]OOV08649.1 hypothetical protein RF819_19845 [Rhodoferax fermentans]